MNKSVIPPSEADFILLLQDKQGTKYTIIVPPDKLPITDINIHEEHLHILMDFREDYGE